MEKKKDRPSARTDSLIISYAFGYLDRLGPWKIKSRQKTEWKDPQIMEEPPCPINQSSILSNPWRICKRPREIRRLVQGRRKKGRGKLYRGGGQWDHSSPATVKMRETSPARTDQAPAAPWERRRGAVQEGISSRACWHRVRNSWGEWAE